MRESARVLELLTHEDSDWRRQGLELAGALGPEVVAQLFDALQRGRWILPPGGALGELLETLATVGEHEARRKTIRSLPPFHTDDLDQIEKIGRGFPRLHELRVVWRGAPDAFVLPTRFGVRHLWLAIPHSPHGGHVRLPNDLVSLSLVGWSAPPTIEGAESLRSLEISGARVAPPVARWSEHLEHLNLGTLPLTGPVRFPVLRHLRAGSLPDGVQTDEPLESLHLASAAGRSVLDLRSLGADTRLRVDQWVRPDPSMQGDPRPRWVGPVEADGWQPLLLTFPRLEVLDLSVCRRGLRLPPHTLPAPRTLWEPSTDSSLDEESHERFVEEWAHRGRDCRLRALEPWDEKERLGLTIRASRVVRSFDRWSLRDAKILVEAALHDRLVALTVAEACQWQALLQLVGLTTEVERT